MVEKLPEQAASSSRPGLAKNGALATGIRIFSPSYASVSIGDVFRASTIFGLAIIVASCADVGAIEAGSNIGSTKIDEIIWRQGYNPGGDFSTEHSPLSNGIREYLVERAKQGGVAAVDIALSEAGAACHPPIGPTRRCELSRFRVSRSVDLIGAKYHRTDWIISVSYDRSGNTIRNVQVRYTTAGGLISPP